MSRRLEHLIKKIVPSTMVRAFSLSEMFVATWMSQLGSSLAASAAAGHFTDSQYDFTTLGLLRQIPRPLTFTFLFILVVQVVWLVSS